MNTSYSSLALIDATRDAIREYEQNGPLMVVTVPSAVTGNKRIALKFAADRARVESFNANMRAAGMPHRTALWRELLGGIRRRTV